MSGRREQQNPRRRAANGGPDKNGITMEKRRALTRSQGDSLSTSSQGAPLSISSQGAALSISSQGAALSISSQGAALSIGSDGAPLSISSQGAALSISSQGAPLSISSQGAPLSISSLGAPLSISSHGAPLSISSQGAPLSISSQAAPLSISSQAAPLSISSQGAALSISSQGAALSISSQGAALSISSQGAPLSISSQGAPLSIGSDGAPLSISSQGAPLSISSEGAPSSIGSDNAPLSISSQGAPLSISSEGAPLSIGSDNAPLSIGSQGAPLPTSPNTSRVTEEQIRSELKDWYIECLSRLHPIPWVQWVETDFTHMFTNLRIVDGQAHEPCQGIDTEESLVSIMWNSGRRTISFIEGSPGTGKSCLCRRLSLSWAKNIIPALHEKFAFVFIFEARTITGRLENCISQSLFPKDFPLCCGDIYRCITECQEKCLFIIDAVDELTGEGKQVVQDLLQGRQFRRANVLLTGRPESRETYIKYVDIHLRIKGFTWENTQVYIHKFFDDNQPQVIDKLLYRIKQDTNLQGLFQTPFTTLLMCLLAEDSGGDIPDSLNYIIKDVLHLTVRRYVSRPKATPTEDTTVEAILRAAAQVAYKGETTGTVVFEESDLETICTHDMSGHLLLSGLFNRDFISSRLDTRGCCYFPHKSIQDFLCALYLADLDVDSLKNTLAKKPDFRENATLCEMLLNMLRDQADKYVAAMTFYWSEGYSKCDKAVVRSALTVTDIGTLDTIIGVLCQYLFTHDLGRIIDVPGCVRLYNLLTHRMPPGPVILLRGVRFCPKTWLMDMTDTASRWSPYTQITSDLVCEHYKSVIVLPVNCGVGFLSPNMSYEMYRDLTLPWVLTASHPAALQLIRHVQIKVLCVCVTPTAEWITDLSSLIDRTRSSDLIVFIVKPRHVTHEDSVYLRVLEVCKRAHSNPVRVSTCTVVAEVRTDRGGPRQTLNTYQLAVSPLHIQYNRHCPY